MKVRGERSEGSVRCCGQGDRRLLLWFWSGRGVAQSQVAGPEGRSRPRVAGLWQMGSSGC